MTKAEKIFKDTRYACKRHIETWGFDNVGFNRMATEEAIFTRTANEIKRLIKREYENILVDLDFEIITEEEAKREAQITKMVELTLENTYICK